MTFPGGAWKKEIQFRDARAPIYLKRVTMNRLATSGQPSPLGTEVMAAGVNFSLFSRTANGVELLLFDREDDAQPAQVITLDPVANRSYHYWHTFVPGVRPGQLYGLPRARADRSGARIAIRFIEGLVGPLWPRNRHSEKLHAAGSANNRVTMPLRQ